MKADGCSYKVRYCNFPKDRRADLIPLDIDDDEFEFFIEWDNRYRNAPLERRLRMVCANCALDIAGVITDLKLESKLIDQYYERSSRESRTRK